MSGGYRGPSQGDFGWLEDELRQIYARLRELETPTGTQMYGTTGHADALQGATVIPIGLSNFETPTITGTMTQFAQISTPVPAGCTRAIVTVIANAGLSNSGAVGSWGLLAVSSAINGTGGVARRSSVSGGQYGSVEASNTQVLTGLSGGTIDVGAYVSFPGTYTAQGVSVSGTIMFLV